RIPAELRDRYHVCVADGEIEVRLPDGTSIDDAARSEFGARFLGPGEESLAERVVARAVAADLRVTVAESCTGGLVAGRLVDVPGASGCFDQSWVTYSDEAKSRELGVDPAVLARYGAVDERVVIAMAEGAVRRARSDVAVAISGIAGPAGGREGKPVGTVWIGWFGPGGPGAKEHRFPGDRDRVRSLSAQHALFSLWCQLPDAL
ncbi:MAG: CinA family protein, partial [Planctomycetota bacterium]